MNTLKELSSERFKEIVVAEENSSFTLGVMRKLIRDPIWSERIILKINARELETRGVISYIARELRPKSYLEIGVRRGFSMGMVVSRSPAVDVYGFDLWVRGYGGVENPGPDFVRNEMARIGHRGRLHLISGSSHKTLPAFFGSEGVNFLDRLKYRSVAKGRPQTFDLITIDGDHSLLGAYQDLMDTMPHCSIGGAVIFDDIAPDIAALGLDVVKNDRGPDPHGWGDLLGVWRAVKIQFPTFRFHEFCDTPPGVGVAVRIS